MSRVHAGCGIVNPFALTVFLHTWLGELAWLLLPAALAPGTWWELRHRASTMYLTWWP